MDPDTLAAKSGLGCRKSHNGVAVAVGLTTSSETRVVVCHVAGEGERRANSEANSNDELQNRRHSGRFVVGLRLLKASLSRF